MSIGYHSLYKFGPFTLDVERRTLVRGADPVGLEPKAFDVLSVLVMRHGNVVDKDELMRRVWPDCFVQESSITQNIHVVRKALGDDSENGSHKYIVTVSRTGYKFVAEVTEAIREADAGGGKIAGRSSGTAVAEGTAGITALGAEDQQELGVQASACSLPTSAGGDGDWLGRDRDGLATADQLTEGVGQPLGRAATARGGRKNHNLPAQPGRLIGREAAIAAVKEMIRGQHRLVTLAGPGGSGKTSLAITVAGELLADFPDGVYLVELAHLSDHSLIIPTIAQTLGVREDGSMPIADCLKSYLEGKRLLLVLDNFEHLMAGELLVVELLASSTELKMMVTSRIVLKVRFEQEYHVEPLALPAPPGRRIDVEELSKCASVALLVERARAVRPEFGLTEENASAVAGICVRVDGLPLAIELTAPWVKVLPPEALLERLNKGFDLLSDGARDLPTRQRTIRATIEWSYGLLTDDEKTLFRNLAVFVGGFTLEAAEAVCAGIDPAELDLLSLLSSLIDKNMVHRLASSRGSEQVRYGMLETLREFGLEALAETSEEPVLLRRHAEFYCQLAGQAEPLFMGPKLLQTLDLIDSELANLRAALDSTIRAGNSDVGMRIASSISQFWKLRGSLREGWRWIEQLINLDGMILSPAAPKALRCAASLAIYRGESELARDYCSKALSICRARGDRSQEGDALKLLGDICASERDYDRALLYLEEALGIFRENGENWSIASSLSDMGAVLQYKGDRERARCLFEESLNTCRALRYDWGIAVGLNNNASILIEQGELKEASDLLAQCLKILDKIGDSMILAHCLESIAEVHCAQEDFERAAYFLGAANSVRNSAGLPIAPYLRPSYEEVVKVCRDKLMLGKFESAWQRGGSMTIDEAISLIPAGT